MSRNNVDAGEVIATLVGGLFALWLVAAIICGICAGVFWLIYQICLGIKWFFVSGTVFYPLILALVVSAIVLIIFSILKIIHLQADHRIETFLKQYVPKMDEALKDIENTIDSFGNKISYRAERLVELGEYELSWSPIFDLAFFDCGRLHGHRTEKFGLQLDIDTSGCSLLLFLRKFQDQQIVRDLCRVYQLRELRKSIYSDGRRLYKKLVNAEANTIQIYDVKTDTMKEVMRLKTIECIRASGDMVAFDAQQFIEDVGQYDLFGISRQAKMKRKPQRRQTATQQYEELIRQVNQHGIRDSKLDTHRDRCDYSN